VPPCEDLTRFPISRGCELVVYFIPSLAPMSRSIYGIMELLTMNGILKRAVTKHCDGAAAHARGWNIQSTQISLPYFRRKSRRAERKHKAADFTCPTTWPPGERHKVYMAAAAAAAAADTELFTPVRKYSRILQIISVWDFFGPIRHY